jgi:hypothetical protein
MQDVFSANHYGIGLIFQPLSLIYDSGLCGKVGPPSMIRKSGVISIVCIDIRKKQLVDF